MNRRSYQLQEPTRSEILQRNEQIKAASSLCVNVGTALVIARAGR